MPEAKITWQSREHNKNKPIVTHVEGPKVTNVLLAILAIKQKFHVTKMTVIDSEMVIIKKEKK